MSTPHIAAEKGAFAETVLLPGDPLRAKFVAENYLQDVQCVNEVRNMLGFTGLFKGERISVMGGGMGIPSASIYATELYQFFDVQNIIRVGSCGSIHPDVNLGDLVVAMGASTDSSVNRLRFLGHDFAAIADYGLLRRWVETAEARDAGVTVGNVFSTDTFYHLDNTIYDVAARLKIVVVEMEAAGLYRIAAEQGRQALCVLTVSDHITKNEQLSAEERETSLGEMMEITLNSLI
ncbi:MAG: purine-nucleoside phosphorylase [Gammaproteobacteria bacterium]